MRGHFAIKALSFTQPYGTLVTAREKILETRSKPTSYRGLVAIHAAKNFPQWARSLCQEEPFVSSLKKAGIPVLRESFSFDEHEGIAVSRIPLQAIIGIGFLADCVSTESLLHGRQLSGKERSFGDFSPDRWAYRFERVVALPEPIFCKGAQGFWTPPPDVYTKLENFIVARAAVA
ncbi:MAG: hypothetical protein C4534_06510 [Gaiellales bacterium]|nr:MAG: hypothetical protein C4534_06510 [Gaiellales bacterium]